MGLMILSGRFIPSPGRTTDETVFKRLAEPCLSHRRLRTSGCSLWHSIESIPSVATRSSFQFIRSTAGDDTHPATPAVPMNSDPWSFGDATDSPAPDPAGFLKTDYWASVIVNMR